MWDEKGLKTGPPANSPFSAQADLHPHCQGSLEVGGQGHQAAWLSTVTLPLPPFRL